MHMPIHEPHVQHAVVGVKVEPGPNRDHNNERHKPDRVAVKRDHGRPAVGISVPHEAFPECPEVHRNIGPEHVVPNLIFEPENLCALHHRAHVVAVFVFLRAKPPKQQMQATSDRRQQNEIAQPDLEHPIELHRFGAGQIGREERPRHRGSDEEQEPHPNRVPAFEQVHQPTRADAAANPNRGPAATATQG